MSRTKPTAKEIFFRWLEEEPTDLDLFLEQACGAGTDLMKEVRELIRIHNSIDGFLDQPVVVRRNVAPGNDSTPHHTNAPQSPNANDATPVVGRPSIFQKHPQIPGYDMLQLLGQGGMGVVYKARHLKLNRIVALKIALPEGHASADEMARFQSEAQALAELDHRNVVKVYEVGSHEGLSFLTMEFCPNGSLETLQRDGGMGFRRAAEVIEQVARGVAAAHAQGLIHRDLKPSNVLIDAHGGLKVTDFGLVKREDANHITATGMILGTPSFMSPEQADRQRRVGPAADVWALGVMLYQLLTNRFPFTFPGDTPLIVLHRVLNEEPPMPRGTNKRIPRDLEVICLKCLSKEPARRYVAANALADDLRRWLNDVPIEARPAGRAERTWKWVRRNPALTAAVLILILGITVSFLFAWKAQRERDEKVIALRQAEREKNQAKESRDVTETFVDFLVEDFLGAARIRGVDFQIIPSGLGTTIEEALRVSDKRVTTRFAGKPLAEAKARHAIGVTWEHLGYYDKAESNLRRAL